MSDMVLTENNALIFLTFSVLLAVLNTVATKMGGDSLSFRTRVFIFVPYGIALSCVFIYGLNYFYGAIAYLAFVILYTFSIMFILNKYKHPSPKAFERSTSIKFIFWYVFLLFGILYGVEFLVG